VSALCEQGRIHHVGAFPDLEDQMVMWEPLSGRTPWIGQYRAYRRDRDGELKDESDGLMRALDLLALSGSMIDAPSEERADATQEDDWAGNRASVTGY
jgi:hypothetical protein